MPPPRLAIVCSHPVQYYAPWFRHLAQNLRAEIHVFYLWDNTRPDTPDTDPGFARPVRWDTDLLSGYAHTFVPNHSPHPGTSRFSGLHNPALPALLRAWHPSAVLLFGYGWRTHLALALAWRDCPLILRGDSHDLGRAASPAPRRLARNLVLRLLFTRFAAFACVGSATRRHYLARGVPPRRIHLVPHCVDNTAFATPAADSAPAALAWRAELGVPAHHRLVLFLGKFVPKKRPDLLLRAFAQLAPPDTTLALVGDGPLAPALRALAAGRPNIVFAPFQNQSAVPRVLAAADLLVLPSQGPEETWGLVVNEAMAAGLPCLVSDHVGCREDLVLENQTGWSFPAGDQAALAAALARALAAMGDPSRAAALRAAALARVQAYSYPRATAALQGVLDALAAPAASSPP